MENPVVINIGQIFYVANAVAQKKHVNNIRMSFNNFLNYTRSAMGVGYYKYSHSFLLSYSICFFHIFYYTS